MADPFLGEIRIWGCTFAPMNWAFCTGQLLPISQYTALFSLLGTNYGGNGTTNFALPDLRGIVPMSWGQSTGGSTYDLGEVGGSSIVTLNEATVPAHTHALHAIPRPASGDTPDAKSTLGRQTSANFYKKPSGAATPQPLAPNIVQTQGGTQPHNNMMPFMALNFCIALQGIFPQRP
jgi:microcystin-dependent protein